MITGDSLYIFGMEQHVYDYEFNYLLVDGDLKHVIVI